MQRCAEFHASPSDTGSALTIAEKLEQLKLQRKHEFEAELALEEAKLEKALADAERQRIQLCLLYTSDAADD